MAALRCPGASCASRREALFSPDLSALKHPNAPGQRSYTSPGSQRAGARPHGAALGQSPQSAPGSIQERAPRIRRSPRPREARWKKSPGQRQPRGSLACKEGSNGVHPQWKTARGARIKDAALKMRRVSRMPAACPGLSYSPRSQRETAFPGTDTAESDGQTTYQRRGVAGHARRTGARALLDRSQLRQAPVRCGLRRGDGPVVLRRRKSGRGRSGGVCTCVWTTCWLECLLAPIANNPRQERRSKLEAPLSKRFPRANS